MELEKWRAITIPGYSHYKVSNMSNVRNSRNPKKGCIMKPSKQGNITLYGDNEKVKKYVHVLSCLAFHGPKPHPSYTVDHIDRDWKNNNINNLRWASKSLQVKNRSVPKSKGSRLVYTKSNNDKISFKSVSEACRYFNIKNGTLNLRLKRDVVKLNGGFLEYDKLIPKRESIIKKVPSWVINSNKEIFASSCGLVKIRNNWTTGHTIGRPGKYFCAYRTCTHRLIAAAFLGKPEDDRKIYVNHKNGNGFDNRIENLEWVSPLENNQHAIYTGLNDCQVPVVQYNLEGIRQSEFTSLYAAARHLNNGSENAASVNIGQACRNSRPSAYNFMWRYKSEAPEQLPPICRKSTVRKVKQYDLDGNLMATFSSGREAAKFFGVDASRISKCCKGKISLGDFTLDNK